MRNNFIRACKESDFKYAMEREETIFSRDFDGDSMAAFTLRLRRIADTESGQLVSAKRKKFARQEIELKTLFGDENFDTNQAGDADTGHALDTFYGNRSYPGQGRPPRYKKFEESKLKVSTEASWLRNCRVNQELRTRILVEIR